MGHRSIMIFSINPGVRSTQVLAAVAGRWSEFPTALCTDEGVIVQGDVLLRLGDDDLLFVHFTGDVDAVSVDFELLLVELRSAVGSTGQAAENSNTPQNRTDAHI